MALFQFWTQIMVMWSRSFNKSTQPIMSDRALLLIGTAILPSLIQIHPNSSSESSFTPLKVPFPPNQPRENCFRAIPRFLFWSIFLRCPMEYLRRSESYPTTTYAPGIRYQRKFYRSFWSSFQGKNLPARILDSLQQPKTVLTDFRSMVEIPTETCYIFLCQRLHDERTKWENPVTHSKQQTSHPDGYFIPLNSKKWLTTQSIF